MSWVGLEVMLVVCLMRECETKIFFGAAD